MKKNFFKKLKNLLTKEKKYDIIDLSKERKEFKAMTKKEMFELIATRNADSTEIVDFCKHEIELLENRKATSKNSLTATQKENVQIKNMILDILCAADDPMTVSDILKTEPLVKFGYSNQKISQLLKQLKDSGAVDKIVDKKKSYFMIAE